MRGVCCLQLVEGVLGGACGLHHPSNEEQAGGPCWLPCSLGGWGHCVQVGAPGEMGWGSRPTSPTTHLDFGQMHVTPISVSKISEWGLQVHEEMPTAGRPAARWPWSSALALLLQHRVPAMPLSGLEPRPALQLLRQAVTRTLPAHPHSLV